MANTILSVNGTNDLVDLYDSTKTFVNNEIHLVSALETLNGVAPNAIGLDAYANINMNPCDMECAVALSIKCIDVYNHRVVKVTFADGTSTKAVCDEKDEFSFDTGVTICLLKRMLSTDEHTGTKQYNHMLRKARHVWDQQREDKLTKAEEKQRMQLKAEKAKRKAAAHAKRRRERRIEEQKEAYLRAMQEAAGGDT